MINFTNITPSSGISTDYSPISSNWVDFNNDNLPDLWLSAHGYYVGQYKPRLYINQGNGTFNNIASQVWPANLPGIPGIDSHGGSWADYDNDGDRDLFMMTGGGRGVGSQPKFLFVNNNGTLVENGVAAGLDFPFGRGRSPLWFDWNLDGKLDLLQVNQVREDQQAPTTLFEQTDNGFVKVIDFPNGGTNNWAAQIVDLGGDGINDVLLTDWGGYKVYENKPSSLIDITGSKFPQTTGIVNTAIADFDGDLVSDLFFSKTMNTNLYSTTFNMNANTAYGRLKVDSGERGISFKTTGDVTFDFLKVPSLVPTTQIFIGANGYNPSNYSFKLSSAPNSTALGIKPRDTQGLYIGYNTTSQAWEAYLYQGPASQTNQKSINTFNQAMTLSCNCPFCQKLKQAESKLQITQAIGSPIELQMVAESTQALSDLTPVNFTPPNVDVLGKKPLFITYNQATGKYVDKTTAAGFNELNFGKNVVAGDFDNDMDVDLFFTNGSSSSLPNVLYENQGNGTFVKVVNAGGANVNSLFPTYQEPILESFIGNSNVSVADYDLDGFLDIFVSGSYLKTTKKIYSGNPSQLYENAGNSNHWLEIDLQGIVSNRDAIGTKVYVTAGGVTQLREQSGGMHGFSQDFPRLHFGLGSNTVVDEIEIHWPSGTIDKINNVTADQLLKIQESANFAGTNQSEALEGGAGNDNINALAGNDTISGLDGDDSLNGGVGNDSLIGGKGNDVYIVDSIGDLTIEDVNAGIDTVNSSISHSLVDRVENLTLITTGNLTGNGNQLANVIVGNNFNNLLIGQEANDTLNGANGDDTLDGGLGIDSMSGGTGNDFYVVDNIADLITEAANLDIDTVSSQISYTLTDNIENLNIIGTDSVNGDGNQLNNVITGNIANNNITGKEGNDSLNGAEGNDSLGGNEGNDSLTGANGDDSLDGGVGNDSLVGGNGNDVYFVDNSLDKVTENANAGIDTIKTLLTRALGTNQENLVLAGVDSINGVGNTVDNQIIGNNGKNNLTGKEGNDTLNGVEGDDNLAGNQGNDYVDGGNGNDILIGNDGQDTLIGGSGNDNLTAIGGQDLLMTGSGYDRVIFNTNAVFNTVSVGQHTITDFTAAIDKIILDKTTFTTITSVNGKGFSVASEFATVSSDIEAAISSAVIVYSSSSGNLFYNPDQEIAGYGIGGQIATLTNNPNLGSKDFQIQL